MATMLKTLFDIVGSDIWLNNGYAKSPHCYTTFTILLRYRIKFKKLDRKCYSDINKG